MRAPPLFVVACIVALAASAGASADEGDAQARTAFQAVTAGDLDRAMAESEHAVAASPTRPLTWKVRGYVLNKAEFPNLALEAYQRAVRLNERDPVTHNNIGVTFLKLGSLQQALTAFEAALALKPQYADARNNRGVALEKMGRRAEAERAYRAATRINPNHALAFNNLGAVQLERGDVKAASASFSRALELDPSFAAPSLNLALMTESGTATEAQVAQLEAMAQAPGASNALRARALAARAALLAGQKDFRGARAKYLDALQLSPQSPALLNNVAVVEDQLGMDRDALLHLTEALDLDPDLYVAQNNVGIVHVHRNDLQLAESVFRALLRDAPRFHRAHYNLGVILAAQGRVRDARQSFRAAARLAPQDADVQYNLALLGRRAGGDVAEEVRGYQRALRLDANLAEAHLSLGTLLADPETAPHLRNTTQALQHLRKFLQLATMNDDEGRRQAQAWIEWIELEQGSPSRNR